MAFYGKEKKRKKKGEEIGWKEEGKSHILAQQVVKVKTNPILVDKQSRGVP